MAPTRTTTASEPQSTTEGDGELSAELARVDKKVRVFVKERPVLALLSAIAAGYLIARLIRRRG